MDDLGGRAGSRKPGPTTATESALARESGQITASGSQGIPAIPAIPATQDERFRAVVAATGQIVWSAAPDGSLRDATSWCAFTGQRDADARDHGWLEAVHAEDRARADAAWRHAVAERDACEMEYRVRRFDGVYRDVLMRAAPVVDTAGAICEWIGFCTDITEQKRREREAQARTRQLEAIFDALTDPLAVFDRDGRIVRMNATAAQLVGVYAEANLLALPSGERARQRDFALRSDLGESMPPALWPVRRILGGETLKGAGAPDIVFRGSSEDDILLNISGAPIRDGDGQITGAVVLARNVTERGRREQHARDAHDALHALLAIAEALVLPLQETADFSTSDTHSIGVRLAELTRRVLGSTRVIIATHEATTEAETQHLTPFATVGFTREEERQGMVEATLDRVADALDERGMERLTNLTNGQAVVIQRTAASAAASACAGQTLLLAPMGLGAGIVGVLVAAYGPGQVCTEDQQALAAAVAKLTALVIERERLLREREEAQASELALRQAKREMDEFLSIASHELRTPLTSIRGFIQLAEQRLKALAAEEAAQAQPPGLAAEGSAHPDRFERVRTVLERAEFQTGQMSRLINELLDASRVHASRLELHLARRDLEATVRDVLEEQRLVWPGRAILLEAPDGPTPVMIDAARIGQVLANFVTNALKYAPGERPVIVRLSVEAGAAQVSVRDFGPGLSAEEHGRIWERFFRSKQITTQHGGDGLGLGLYISRAIVERHGGRVGVESRPGDGATFFFVLPLAGIHEPRM